LCRSFDLLAQLQRGNDLARPRVLVGRLVGRPGDDQRRPRLVDQDRVHLVDDGVVVPALHAIFDLELHVVAQVVEAEFVVGSVGDVGGVGGAALVVVQVVDDHAHGQPQKLVDLAHPLGVALGQVVVHRDHVHAVAGQRVQIAGQRGHQRLAFAGLHLGDLALVQHHAADQLHVEVAHLHRAPAGLAHHRKGLGQNLVQRLPLGRLLLRPRSATSRARLPPLARSSSGFSMPFSRSAPARNPRPELDRLGPQLLVGKLASCPLPER
jgi:hypothetical protein